MKRERGEKNDGIPSLYLDDKGPFPSSSSLKLSLLLELNLGATRW